MLLYRNHREPHDIEFLYITVVSEVLNKCSWTQIRCCCDYCIFMS